MKRKHRMPFGAEILDPDRTRFHLWAPSAREVTLVLMGEDGVARSEWHAASLRCAVER